MKVSVEKKPNSEAVLNVDVTWDEMEKASDKAYRKLVKQVDIQGFRRGKAPRSSFRDVPGKESKAGPFLQGSPGSPIPVEVDLPSGSSPGRLSRRRRCRPSRKCPWPR